MFFCFQPLDQFEINPLYKLPFVFIINNFMIYVFFVCLCLTMMFSLSSFVNKIISNHFEIILENLYKFIFNIFCSQLGSTYKKSQHYFPFLFYLFYFLLISNLFGMTAYGFTITSHIALTFCLSLSIFFSLTIIGIYIQKYKFIDLFIPKNVPIFLLPFLCVIEIISYISRAFSLAIRLFSNLTSGHTLLNILSSFAFILSKKYIWVAFIVFVIVFIITILELFIAALQAYVFLILITIYLNDSLNISH